MKNVVRRNLAQGFTLIELMIVAAILGILAAIALPAYQDYTIRAKVAEALSLATAAKTAVTEYYVANGQWPADNIDIGFNEDDEINGKWARKVTVGTGGITITFNDLGGSIGRNAKLGLTPYDMGGSIQWVCGRASVQGTPDSKAPKATKGRTSDNLPDRYLPANCRASAK